MDIVTHGLAGFLVGQGAFRKRWGFPATLAVTAGALAPDVDTFAFAWDRVAVLTYHRGLTHSLFGMPPLALATGGLISILAGRRHYWRLAGLAALGIAIHILLDLPTAFGTRVLYPLSAERFRLDLFHVLDPAVTGIVLAGLLAGWRWPPRRAFALGTALGAIVVYAGLAFPLRLVAEGDFRAAAAHLDVAVERVAILPRLGSPLIWRGVAATADGFVEGSIQIFGSSPATVRHRRDPALETPVPAEVEALEVVRRYRQFARYPLAVVKRAGSRTIVEYQDLAFGPPGPRNAFYLTVTMNGEGSVEAITFNHRF